MNIVFYLPNINLGGIAQNSIKLSNEFIKFGHSVTFLLHNYNGEYTAIMPNKIVVENMHVANVIFALPKIETYLKKHDVDLLITSRDLNNSMVLLWTHLKNVNCKHLMVTCHTNAIIENRQFKSLSRKLKTFVYMKLARLTYKWADSIVCVSKGVANATSKYSNIPLENINVIYNPIVTEDFDNRKNEPIIEDFWKDNDGKKVIVGAGRLTEQKNWPMLIRAFAKAYQKNSDIRLYILGEGELRQELEKLIEKLHMNDNVVLPGFVPNPLKFIAAADLFVSTSNWEGFGNSIAEALATGTYVIATDCPSGPAEILKNGQYGTLIEKEDEESFSSAITTELLINHDKQLLISRGRDFATEKIAREYLKITSKYGK